MKMNQISEELAGEIHSFLSDLERAPAARVVMAHDLRVRVGALLVGMESGNQPADKRSYLPSRHPSRNPNS